MMRSLYAKLRSLENQRMAKHLLISGRVQGVGFRYSMGEEAERLGATGWVRNRRDGTVEAVVDGAPEWWKPSSPGRAADRLGARAEVRVSEIPGSFERFEMRPTG